MPSNRDLLIAQRKKQRGLPETVKKFFTPKTAFSSKIDRPTPKKTGIQTRGIGGRIEPEQPETVDLGLATEGIKGVDDEQINKRFGALTPEQAVTDESGIPSNVNISPKRVTQPRTGGVSSFGLPTDRLPSFSELGGAIGQMFKFVGGITKKRQALGLIPGRVNIPTRDKGLSLTQKDRATILTKRLEDLTLTDVERTDIKAELDAILNPQKAEESSDILSILNE